jgi:hypothetical protein
MDILKEIGEAAALEQLAEECAELGKAALKMARIIRGENPTPRTADSVRDELSEEASDVLGCVHLLRAGKVLFLDEGLTAEKMKRWVQRITEAKENKHES